ncbi:MAG: putative helicase/exonuclease [Faunusvirus sp.]|jgi:hypothetical protein|uniref:Putative helicase/exonuclease n=1 Tax=Faunusvirus sp. TaxID=2487766 RepID=A0A3G5A0M9_9VIRU|nr:MAG: putative helicase/exonuclease [Faunusvirus sp.]
MNIQHINIRTYMEHDETPTLPPASDEQLFIINNIISNNIIVDSVAGSGKTTTNLYIAKTFPKCQILLLTYNKKLKLETRKRVIQHKLENVEVHSYHSFCVKYYKRTGYTDTGIKNMLKKPTDKQLKPFKYDLIILDECQDMTPLYYKLVCKIFKNNKIAARICILGDRYQSIYDFNDADSRYITFADKVFGYTGDPWCKVTLSRSFRLTRQMALFVNKCLLKQDKIVSMKEGFNVRYIMCDVFGDALGSSERPYEEVKYYLNNGYKIDEIFILAPSVKSDNCPARQLANKLTSMGIKIYVPNTDEEKVDEDLLVNKLAFSTFHQVKGLERKVVIVFSCDNSYFTHYKKDSDPNVCPNELYVAATRGLEHLSLLHHYKNDYLPFLDRDALVKYCDVELQDICLAKSGCNNIKTSVTGLVKHLPVDVVHTALSYIDVVEITKPGETISILNKTQQDDIYEGVSEITGIAVPAYLELKHTGKMSIYREDNDDSYFIDEDDTDKTDKIDINIKTLTCSNLLYIANMWYCQTSGYTYKLMQIKYYDWLEQEKLNKCIERLERYITNDGVYERDIIIENQPELRNRRLMGYIDCINNNNVWELKCVQQLEHEHMLQLALYMYLILKDHEIKSNVKLSGTFGATKNKSLSIAKSTVQPNNYQYHLYNILTDQHYHIKSDMNRLINLVEYLIKHKYFTNKNISDEEFIANNEIIFDEFYE